jgi:hypothetical protein
MVMPRWRIIGLLDLVKILDRKDCGLKDVHKGLKRCTERSKKASSSGVNNYVTAKN